MKSVMLTIRLKWFYLTYKGIKTIEVRKSCPKNFRGDVYEYVSKTNFEKDLMEIPENEKEFFKQFKGKVGLKFTLNKVEEITTSQDRFKEFMFYETSLDMEDLLKQSCLDYNELDNYLYGEEGYAWYIDNLVIFDKPKELSEFYTVNKYGIPQYEFGLGTCDYRRPKAPQSMCYVEVEK